MWNERNKWENLTEMYLEMFRERVNLRDPEEERKGGQNIDESYERYNVH
jgi:hypothetical protein